MTDLRAMIVDDSPTMRSVMEKALSAIGVSDIDYAGNGMEALRCFRSRRHDLILLDNMMPRMTGLEFLMELRADPYIQKAHVIMITGLVDEHLIALIRGQRMKVNDLMVKPLDVAKLQRKVVELIARRQKNNIPSSRPDQPRPPPSNEQKLPLSCGIINRGTVAILELKGALINDHKDVINATLKQLQNIHAKIVVIDVNEIKQIDDFGYGTLLIINGYMATFEKKSYISLDDCPMKDHIIDLGITKIIPTRRRAADAIDI